MNLQNGDPLNSTNYTYKLNCGCGHTYLKLNIDDGNNFYLNIDYKWMGSGTVNDTYTGDVHTYGNMHYLYTNKYNDHDCTEEGITTKKNTLISFMLIELNQFDKKILTYFDNLVPINEHFIEYDAMVMGGASLNKDGKYNALLIPNIGENFGAYQISLIDNDIGQDNEFKNVKLMKNKIFPMLKIN